MKIPFTNSNGGEQSPASLIAALGLVALVPTVGVLWFMTVAMRNERLAVQERLTGVYLNHLTALQRQVTSFWQERQAALKLAAKDSAAESFAAWVRAKRADAVVIYDASGKLLYPTAVSVETPRGETDDLARALQAQVAELLKAGQKEQALAKLAELTGDARLRKARGGQGALIVPNAQLLILKTIPAAEVDGPFAALRGQALDDLTARLNDYSDTDLPSSQRRFLMAELQALVPGAAVFSTRAAEELAAEYLEAVAGAADPGPASAKPTTTQALQRTPLAKVWSLGTADRNVVALYRETRVKAELTALLAPLALPDVRVALLAPGESLSGNKRAPELDAGEFLPGWRLALSFDGGDPLASASERQKRFYLWIGLLVVLIIAVLALLVARYVAAQMRLARLKNELVSTVSHELKTPLASMRALVDTLAAGRFRDEAQLRDYLQLIAKENHRLGQLIENFLTFSRLERGQQRFRFEALAPAAVVNAAVDGLREKLESPHCRFEVSVPADLPRIRGDAEALTTVLINLLDNACKYTNEEKRISARAHADRGRVWFEVADDGIGLAPQESRRIFERFYQVDQSLTRQRGGCGLGLSIVKSIVEAHRGSVEVRSQPGKGSTFRVGIPVAGEGAAEPMPS